MKIFSRVLILLIFCCACWWVSCGEETAPNDSPYQEKDGQIVYSGEKDNRLVVHLLSEPSGLHPTNGRGGSRTVVQSYLYQQLVRISIKDGSLVPELAKSLPEVSEDQLTYTFEIDPDAKWDDGAPITTEDVLFSLKANICPLTENYGVKSYLDFLETVSLDPSDNRKITLKMTQRYIHNPYFMTNLYILDRRMFDPENKLATFSIEQLMDNASGEDPNLKAWAAEFNDAKYGRDPEMIKGFSGPYELTQWLADQQVILTRKENYWGKGKESYVHDAYPDQLVFKFMRDANALELELQQEQIDVTWQLSTLSYDKLQEGGEVSEDYQLTIEAKDGITIIFLNNRPDGGDHKRIFDDKAVRKAMAYLVPVDQMIEEFYLGHAVRTASPIPPSNSDYNQLLPIILQNVSTARKLLADAGWADTDNDQVLDKEIEGERVPLSFKLTYPSGQQVIEELIGMIQAELKTAGIECIPDPVSMQILGGNLGNNDYDAIFIALGTAAIPYDFKQLWHSTGWPGSNWSGFANQRADELIDSSRVEMNETIRKRMVDELQEIIQEEQPCIFMYSPTNKVAIHRRFNQAEVYKGRYYINLGSLQMIRE